MPDAAGRFRGITVPAAAWERVFGASGERQPLKLPTCSQCGGRWYASVQQCRDCGVTGEQLARNRDRDKEGSRA